MANVRRAIQREGLRERHVRELLTNTVMVPHGFKYLGKIELRHYIQNRDTHNIYRSIGRWPTVQDWLFCSYEREYPWSDLRTEIYEPVERIRIETSSEYRGRGGRGPVYSD